MRPLVSAQLSCFGTSGSQHPTSIAALVQRSAEENGLEEGSSGVCRLANSGSHLKVLLLPAGPIMGLRDLAEKSLW